MRDPPVSEVLNRHAQVAHCLIILSYGRFSSEFLGQVASADRQESDLVTDKTQRLEDKIAKLKEEMARLKKLEVRMLEASEQQISLTDPDARSMATSGRGTVTVGYPEARCGPA